MAHGIAAACRCLQQWPCLAAVLLATAAAGCSSTIAWVAAHRLTAAAVLPGCCTAHGSSRGTVKMAAQLLTAAVAGSLHNQSRGSLQQRQHTWLAAAVVPRLPAVAADCPATCSSGSLQRQLYSLSWDCVNGWFYLFLHCLHICTAWLVTNACVNVIFCCTVSRTRA